MEKECIKCGTIFKVHNYRKDDAKYCSETCRRISFGKLRIGRVVSDEHKKILSDLKSYERINRVCMHKDCNTIFKVAFNSTQKFCSRECANNSKSYLQTDINNGFYNKKHSEESRKKMSEKAIDRVVSDETRRKNRLAQIVYVEKKKFNGGQLIPNYNIKSIPILEAKAKELGITDLQHAENGGEYYIEELGYWLDGYSKEKNIAFEYDEKHHFNNDGTYTERDIRRQTEIKNLLGCKFIRIKAND